MNTGHVGINVTNLDRAQSFYSEIFGLTRIGGDTGYAFLGDGTNLVLTLWEQAKGTFDRDRAGLHHLSFQVESIDAVRKAEQAVRKLGAKLHHDGIVPHREGADSGGIWFEDPDGTRLEIFTATGAGERKAPTEGPTCGFF